MYHRLALQTHSKACLTLLAVSIAAQIILPVSAQAEELPVAARTAETHFPLTPNVKELKRRPDKVELYEYDSTPLGNRQPLLFVHGMRGEFWPDCFRWRKLCQFLSTNQDFRSRYKIYFTRYDSYLPLPKLTPELQTAIERLSQRCSSKQVSIIALSMGGNIVVDAMTDSSTDARVNRVITLGTPFHGSPLFTSGWMRYSMMKSHITPFTQLDTCLPYEIYFGKHENLLTNLHWDNSDAMLPSVDSYRIWFHPLRSVAISPTAANRSVLNTNADPKLNKGKFTVYGGYLSTELALEGTQKILTPLLYSPVWFSRTVVPEHLGKEHAVLRLLNRQMAYAVAADGEGTGGHVYGLNDGITPLSSSLFLSNGAMNKVSVRKQQDVAKLKDFIDVRRARVFANIDHLTFIDEYRPRGAAQEIRDELAADGQSKPMFKWILDDLVFDGKSDELATGPQGDSSP